MGVQIDGLLVISVTQKYSGNVSISGTLTYEDVTNELRWSDYRTGGLTVSGGDVKVGSKFTIVGTTSSPLVLLLH